MTPSRTTMRLLRTSTAPTQDWRSKQKEETETKVKASANWQASRDFAERTMKRWRANNQTVDQRAETLLRALATQTSDEYVHYNDSDNLQEHLRAHGIKLNVDHLKKEIKRGDCQLLKISQKKTGSETPVHMTRTRSASSGRSGDGEEQVVRCVRIVRVVVASKTINGIRTLIDGDPAKKESGDHFPTGKVGMSAGAAETAWLLVLHDKLGLAVDWLQQFISVKSCAETVVEVQTSNKFPGLPTWYIVDEVNVRVNENSDHGELKLLGLPLGIQFRGTGKHRQRLWLWADTESTPDEVPEERQRTSGLKMAKVPSHNSRGHLQASNMMSPSPSVRSTSPSKSRAGDDSRIGSKAEVVSPNKEGRDSGSKSCPPQPQQSVPSRSDMRAEEEQMDVMTSTPSDKRARGRSAIGLRTENAGSLATNEPVKVEKDIAKQGEAVGTSSPSGEASTTRKPRGRSGIRTRDLDAAQSKMEQAHAANEADVGAGGQAAPADKKTDNQLNPEETPKAGRLRGRSAARTKEQ